MLTISQEGIAITNRFFEAIETLKKLKKIRGLHSFTDKYKLNYWNTSSIKNSPSNKVLKPEFIYYLVTGYGISAEWLITGEGEMFKKIAE